MSVRILLILICLLLGSPLSGWAERVTLLPRSSEWKYFKGTKSPSLLPTFWSQPSFKDDSWLSGITPLYYGGNIASGTHLSDMRGYYSSVYMRKTFLFPEGEYSSFTLNALSDDGFILWLNGMELFRYNVPDSNIGYDGVAESLITVPVWQAHNFDDLISSTLLPGEINTFAIQAFNVSLDNSGDFAIDIELTAEVSYDFSSPTIVDLYPQPEAQISNTPWVTVTFSEPVLNVTHSDLLCDGKAASSIRELNSSQYLFEFPGIGQNGRVFFNWDPDTKICDASPNANPFSPPGEEWYYDVRTDLSVPKVQINEIMAVNSSSIKNRQGEYVDWIELYNFGDQTIDIGGWYLTDSAKNLTQWSFPQGTMLQPGGYLVVFCDSSYSQPLLLGEYHANFSLSQKGEYLALVYSDGHTIIHELSPTFPAQRSDISYGQGLFYTTPTPGKSNAVGYMEPVAEIEYSEPRGYKLAPFQLTLSTPTEGAFIYYTLDGTVPDENSTPYKAPLQIDKITTLRAVAIKEGHLNSTIATRTWLFMEEVLTQPTSTPPGWPVSGTVNGHRMEYGMNLGIVNSAEFQQDVRKGLTNIQSISMVTDLENLFNRSTGIYVNPAEHDTAWERPASFELIDPNGGGEFQIDAGIRIRGAASRTSSNPKHSFRIFFRSSYGGELNFPLFGDEGVSVFDKVDLRTSQNYSWAFEQTPYETFIRETFARDAQRDVGMPYTRSRYYHLYINGQYWGLYQTQERSETSYAESYLGGDKEDWDLLKTEQPQRTTVVSEGNDKAARDLFSIAVEKGFSGANYTNYYYIKGLNPDGTINPNFPVYLDEVNLQEYMLNVYVTCDTDSPISVWGGFANNLFGLYNRVNPTGFKWFRHDGEHALGGRRFLGYGEFFNLVDQGWDYNNFDRFNPMRLHQKLMEHPEYRIKFIDLVQKRILTEGGEFTLPKNIERWDARMSEIYEPIVVESARWGHGFTRNDWLKECNYVTNVFFNVYPDNLIANFRARGWFPLVDAPSLSRISGQPPSEENPLRITAKAPVYCTTDGSDPRLPDGTINPNAILLQGENLGTQMIIPKESGWKYFDSGSAPPRIAATSWFIPHYNDSTWKEGSGRLGFGGKESTTVESVVPATGAAVNTVYFRTYFDMPSGMSALTMTVNLNCDDGAVVYLNGSQVIRHNMPVSSQYSTYALTEVISDDETSYKSYTIPATALISKGNVLAVEVHRAEESVDLYFDLELLIPDAYPSNYLEVKIPNEENPNISSPFFKARSYNGLEWSAISEADFTVYANYWDLKLTEMMYSPAIPNEAELARGWSRDDFAWLELQNTGRGVLMMKDIQFTTGISFVFPEANINPSERLVLVKNLEAFSSRYDTNSLNLFQGYSGNLARRGETLTLSSPTGETIFTFTYSNTWYPQTDQGNYSLVVVDINAEDPLWSLPENWKPSSVPGGTPGLSSKNSQPVIANASVAENGVLCFNVSGAETFFIEVSRDMKSWSLLESWEVLDGLISIDTKLLGEEFLFFRIRL